MFTNDLKKGEHIRQSNGWDATIEDNLKGNTRLCTVYGLFTEMGSVYSHDIAFVYVGGKGMTIEEAKMKCQLEPIEHTPAQLKLKQRVNELGF